MLWSDRERAAREIARVLAEGRRGLARASSTASRASPACCARSTLAPPPSIDGPTAGDIIELLKAGRRFRALGRTDAYRLLRWMPMAVADLVGEWFETEPLRATIAAGGVLGSFLGPWSAGSGALLLQLGAGEGHPIASGWFARGGTGAVTDALATAARQAGAEIRTGAEVREILVDDGGARRRAGERRRDPRARRRVDADPKRTLLGLVDPMHLSPDFVRQVGNIRMHGTLAKVNYAVSALPRFAGLASLDNSQQMAALSGRIRLARRHRRTSSARSTPPSTAPARTRRGSS